MRNAMGMVGGSGALKQWLQYILAVGIGAAVSSAVPRQAAADLPGPLSAQTVKGPTGPSSQKGLGESFSASVATGTGSYSIPLEVPPSLLEPKLSLVYSAGRGKSEYGLSFWLPLLEIRRTTDKGSPKFAENDRFAVEDASGVEELVPVDASRRYFRSKVESAFVLYERDAGNDRWVVHFPDGGSAVLGGTVQSRENSNGRAFRWRIEELRDSHNHTVLFEYWRSLGRLYPLTISYQLGGSESHINRVRFEYAARSDVYTDYSYGAAITTSQRVTRITMTQGGRVLRTYDLGYEVDASLSTLTSVKVTGEGGVSLPPLTLNYLKSTPLSGNFVTMSSRPPTEGLVSGLATLEDMNADGLPDLLVGQAGNYRYYENLDGVRWSTTPVAFGGDSPDRNLNEAGVVLTDVDGDGYRDVAYIQSGELRYHPGGWIQQGIGRGYRSRVALPAGSSGVGLTDATAKLVDLNADGRTDLLVAKPGATDAAILNLANTGLVESPIAKLPSDAALPDPRVLLLDLNGDSVLDLVRAEYEQRRLRVWYGLGAGAYTDAHVIAVPEGAPSEFHFADVNRDGQTDLVRISGSWAYYFLNLGNDTFSGQAGEYKSLPRESLTQRVFFADMNGNGSRDILWLTNNGDLHYLDLMGEPNVGLLSRVDNGMGAVTEINYRSSTQFAVDARVQGQRWKTPLPHPVPVIDEIRNTDSLGLLGCASTISTERMSYRDGYYDGTEREFRGFGTAILTEVGDTYHETSVTETRFYVGRNLDSGADEEALKGRAYQQIVRDVSGAVVSSVETKWLRRWLCQSALPNPGVVVLPDCARFSVPEDHKDELVQVALQTDVLNGMWERTSTPRFVGEHRDYDPWGFLRRIERYGEVAFAAGHIVGAPWDLGASTRTVGGDEVVEETERLYDAARWLIGLVHTTRKKAYGTELTLSQSRTYYDGAAFVGLPLGEAQLGEVTREEHWLAAEDRWVQSSRVARDLNGKIINSMDPVGNVVTMAYDVETGQFPVLEEQDVEAGTVRFSAAYDIGTGSVTSVTGPNGQQTRFLYDGFGRLTQVIDPLSSEFEPTTTFSYEDAAPISTTTVQHLVNHGTGQYRETRIYIDGHGKTRLTKVDAEQPLGYVGSGWAEFSSRGAAVRTFDAFASGNPGFESASSAAPAHSSHYDLLGRVTRSDAPATTSLGVTSTVTEYRPLETRLYAERDIGESTTAYPKVTRTDGLGRIREVQTNNQNGSLAQSIRWTIDYDPLGNITTFADVKGNQRGYTYDSLGRLLTVSDPNLGQVNYTYNDAGQVTLRRDALGQEQRNVYGMAGRLSSVTHVSSGSGVGTETFSFHYDAAATDTPLANPSNLMGALAWVEGPFVDDHFSYDELGRETQHVAELWDGISPYSAQTRKQYAEQRSYNAAGEILTKSLPGGLASTFEYNQRGLVSRVMGGLPSDVRTLVNDIVYNASGLPLREEHGNGTRSCQRYDERKRLIGAIVGRSLDTSCTDIGVGNKGFQHLGWTWSYDGMLARVEDFSVPNPSGTRLDAAYQYDRVNQLTSVVNAFGTKAFEYDPIQNLTLQRTVAMGATQPTDLVLQYGSTGGTGPNRATKVGPTALDYDAIGNLRRYNSYDLIFNVAGQLVQATKQGEKSLRYYYDAAGDRRLLLVERPGESPQVYAYPIDGYEIRNRDEHWRVSAGTATAEMSRVEGLRVDTFLLDELTEYVAAPAGKPKPLPQEFMDLNGDGHGFDSDDLSLAQQGLWNETAVGGTRTIWRYFHRDLLGSTVTVSDSTGDVVSSMRYHPYGETAERHGLQPSRGYTGAESEPDQDLGIIRMGARYYAPAIGRWITPDRFIGEDPMRMASTPFESGLFSYASNNPIVFSDPSGKQTTPEAKVASLTEPYLREAAAGGPGCGTVMTCGPSKDDVARENSSGLLNQAQPGYVRMEQRAKEIRNRELDKAIAKDAIQSVPLVDMVLGGAVTKAGRMAYGAYEAAAMARISEGMLSRTGGEDIVSFAKGLQGAGNYPGVDSFRATTLREGTIIYGGVPGQSNFYTTARSLRLSGGDAAEFSQGLQVAPHPTLGYRPGVTAYRVTGDTEAAIGLARANPQHGPGGFTQLVIKDFETKVEPLFSVPMRK